MDNIPVLPLDRFMVINKTIFTETDRKILTMLYQPILGCNAVTIYLILRDLLDKIEVISNCFTHYDIMNYTGLSMTEVSIAINKLEGIGLVKAYLKEDKVNSYIYELYSPATSYQFLNDPILSTSLYNSIGKEEYDRLVGYFKIPDIDLSEYKDITLSFSDTFMMGDIIDNIKIDKIKNTNRLDLKIDNVIDTNSIIASIPTELLNYHKVTKDIKNIITKLALVYNFNEEEMTDIVKNSIINKNIELVLLQDTARKYYAFNNSGRLPGLVYANQPDYLKKKVTGVSKKDKAIHAFETTSPYQFLQAKNKCKPTSIELDILKYLLVDMDLKPGVINVLLDYVLRINDNKMPKKYVETIAAQWKKSNIETVEDAMELASREYNKRKDRKVIVSRTETKVPAWMKEEVKVEKASIEEQEEFLKKLNSME